MRAYDRWRDDYDEKDEELFPEEEDTEPDVLSFLRRPKQTKRVDVKKNRAKRKAAHLQRMKGRK